jgi:hypothetical protein
MIYVKWILNEVITIEKLTPTDKLHSKHTVKVGTLISLIEENGLVNSSVRRYV